MRAPWPAALPTLDINEGALNSIFSIYKELLPAMGGYITHAGELDRSRLEMVRRGWGVKGRGQRGLHVREGARACARPRSH